MRKNISIACLLAAWLCANGMIWNVVQVVAWARMYRDFSQTMTAGEALQRTFDGSAPCPLCHLAQSGEDNSRRQSPNPVTAAESEKILLACDATPAVIFSRPDVSWPAIAEATGLIRTESVPVPPPRV